MRKYFNLLLIGALVIGMSACNKKNNNEPDDPSNGQGQEEVSNASLKLEVSNITATTFNVTITPTDDDVYYLFVYDTQEGWAYYGYDNNDDAYILEDDLAYWVEDYNEYADEYAEEGYGDSFEEVYLYQGQQSGTIEGLKPNTGYVAYAYIVKKDGSSYVGSDLVKVKFTTAEGETSDITLTATVDAATGIVTIKPSNNDPYYVILVDDETLNDEEEGYAGDKEYAFDESLEWEETFAQWFGYEIEPYTGEASLAAGEWVYDAGDYHVLVAGWNGEYRTSDVSDVATVTVTADMISDYDDDDDSGWFAPRRAKSQHQALKNHKAAKRFTK